jgi:hypothetical protein
MAREAVEPADNRERSRHRAAQTSSSEIAHCIIKIDQILISMTLRACESRMNCRYLGHAHSMARLTRLAFEGRQSAVRNGPQKYGIF